MPPDVLPEAFGLQTSSALQVVSQTAKALQTGEQDVSYVHASLLLQPVVEELTFVHFGALTISQPLLSVVLHVFVRSASGTKAALTIGVDLVEPEVPPEPWASPRMMVPSECGGWSAGSSDSSAAGVLGSRAWCPAGVGSAIDVLSEVAHATTAEAASKTATVESRRSFMERTTSGLLVRRSGRSPSSVDVRELPTWAGSPTNLARR